VLISAMKAAEPIQFGRGMRRSLDETKSAS